VLACVAIHTAAGLPHALAERPFPILGIPIDIGLITLCLVAAYNGWFFRTARSIRWMCLLGAFTAFALAMSVADKASQRLTGSYFYQSPKPQIDLRFFIAHSILPLLLAILTIVSYHVVARWLVTHLDLVDNRTRLQRLDSAKRSLGLIAFLIFASGGDFPDFRQFSVHKGDMQDATIIFGPIILAVAIYKLGMYFAARRINQTPAPGTTRPAI
jgi:hypothetical protein